ncbi:MAG TPA: hypothetical protein VH092_15020 [Urbifossiella sp.]|jgi:hypothetical protein|nr:hypothetical protein [Urbifossiella sp.]
MKLVALGVAALAVAIVIGGSAGAAGASDAFSCKIKQFKVKGFPAVGGCGPATADLTVSGKTYRFKDGQCGVTGTGSNRSITVDLGTTVQDPKGSNGGYPLFTLGTFGTKAIIVADYQGKAITGTPGPGLVPVKLKGKYAGTFASTGKLKISGSWNCHGVLD